MRLEDPNIHKHERDRQMARERELRDALRACDWFMAVLAHVSAVDPPHWWVGAGVIRDIVWDQRFGRCPRDVSDVDVAFFDASDLSRERDGRVQEMLRQREPRVSWDATNQAAVHTWYPQRFGVRVAPLRSVPEAVATWPEFAVCVAVRLHLGGLEICAPYGLEDLLDGVWRRNPARVTQAEYARRLESKQPSSRWEGVRILD
jgi:uncharacterized protein